MRPTSRALIIFLFISILLFIRSIYFDKYLSSDQMFFQLVYLGKTEINYSDYRVPALDSYIPFVFTNYLRQFFQDPIWVYRSILPVLIFLYLTSFYVILKKLIQKEWISIIVPLVSLLPRKAMASMYWGIITIGHATHRAFLQPFFILFFYLLYRYQHEPKRLTAIFLLFGIVSSLYPTQSFYLVAISFLTLLITNHFAWKTWRQCVLYGIAFLLGTLYYILPNLTIGLNIDPLDPMLIPEFNEALRYRFSYTFYPGSLYTYTRSILLDSALLFAIYIFINKKIHTLSSEHQKLLHFSNINLLSVGIITFGMPLIQDIISALFHTRLLIFEQFATSRFAYLNLYIGFALFLLYIRHHTKISFKKSSIYIVISITLLTLTNFFLLYDLIKKIYPLTEFSVTNPNFQETCEWIKINTDPSLLLITEDFNFRLCTERKIFVSWKDGMVYLYRSPKNFIEWYRRLREQQEAYAQHDIVTLLTIAKNQNGSILIDKLSWPEITTLKTSILFENNRYIFLHPK